MRGLGASRAGHAVLRTVQKGVVEADIVGSTLPAWKCPVDDSGVACVIDEGTCVRARASAPEAEVTETPVL